MNIELMNANERVASAHQRLGLTLVWPWLLLLGLVIIGGAVVAAFI
jgi:hypothetical protein